MKSQSNAKTTVSVGPRLWFRLHSFANESIDKLSAYNLASAANHRQLKQHSNSQSTVHLDVCLYEYSESWRSECSSFISLEATFCRRKKRFRWIGPSISWLFMGPDKPTRSFTNPGSASPLFHSQGIYHLLKNCHRRRQRRDRISWSVLGDAPAPQLPPFFAREFFLDPVSNIMTSLYCARPVTERSLLSPGRWGLSYVM